VPFYTFMPLVAAVMLRTGPDVVLAVV